MGLKAPDGTDLKVFYDQNPCLNMPCEDSDETDWWRFTPYNWEETKYYIIKMPKLKKTAVLNCYEHILRIRNG